MLAVVERVVVVSVEEVIVVVVEFVKLFVVVKLVLFVMKQLLVIFAWVRKLRCCASRRRLKLRKFVRKLMGRGKLRKRIEFVGKRWMRIEGRMMVVEHGYCY